MKRIYIVILVVIALGIIGNLLPKNKGDEKDAPDSPQKAAPNSFLVNTTWRSEPLTIFHSNDSDWNVVMLHFSKDSVSFWLPYGSWSDASDLLSRTIVRNAVTHYSWEYSVDGNTITLDPGISGWSIPLEHSGGELHWKGHLPPGKDGLVLKKME